MAWRVACRYHSGPNPGHSRAASSRRTIVESLKPILLLVVLGGVAYAVYVALNHAPPTDPPGLVETDWNKPAVAEPGAPATNRMAENPATSSTADAPSFKAAPASIDSPRNDPSVGSPTPPLVQPTAPTNAAPPTNNIDPSQSG